ncbi:MAG: cache domain-containing protein [Pseudomonadales bacterium]|nr:cache domain-containing protein [Pseudomonadales bacterium]
MAQEARHTEKRYKIYPLWEGIAVALATFFAITATSSFIYIYSIEAQEGEIRDGLVRTAQVIAATVDGDAHATFTGEEARNTPAYEAAIEPFRIGIDIDLIAYVYTTVMKDGKVYFVLDPVPPEEEDAVEIMEEYEDALPDLIKAHQTQEIVVAEEPQTDQWGTYISGYVPIHDSQGNFVAVLGLDIPLDKYLERLEPIKLATQRAIVTGFFISFLMGSIIWFLRNFIAVLNAKRLLLKQDYDVLLGASLKMRKNRGEK